MGVTTTTRDASRQAEHSVGTLLRRWRQRAMLTQEELAARAGLDSRTVRRLEADGLRRPRTSTLRLLSDGLGLGDDERSQLSAALSSGGARRGASGGSTPATLASVPHQLPATTADFTGRQGQLRELDALLSDGKACSRPEVVIAAIAGTAGIGKTTLAVHWAQHNAGRFADGQLYVNLRGFDAIGRPVGASEAVRGFLDALGVMPEHIPAELDGQAALYRSVMADRRMLVLLDNAVDEEQVRPLLPASAGSMVLITSRNQLSGLVTAEGAHPLVLSQLTDAEAYDLLERRLGAARLTAESRATKDILARCAGLPLALAIVAARATMHPAFSVRAIAAELDTSRTGLEPFTSGDTTTNLRAVFSWSYRQLEPDTKRLFRLLGLHPGPDITAPAAASVAGRPLTTVHALLRDLCRAHLLTEHGPGRYTFHDLLRAYAGELNAHSANAVERHATIDRIVDHYLHAARVASRVYNPGLISLEPFAPPGAGVTIEPFMDADQASAWFAAELPVLLHVARLARQRELDQYTWRLAVVLTDYLNRQGQWSVLLTLQRAGLEAALRLGDPVGQMRIRRGLAYVLIQLGRYDEVDAHLRETLDLAHRFGDVEELANTYHGLAFAARHRGRIDVAIQHKEQSEELLRTAGKPEAHAIALNDAGWYHALAGNHEKALAYCHRALDLIDELDYRHGEAVTTNTLGYANHHLGRYDRAATYYERAINASRAAGDREIEAYVLHHIGDNHAATGDQRSAHDAWRQSLDIFEELGHHDATAVRTKLESLGTSTSGEPGDD